MVFGLALAGNANCSSSNSSASSTHNVSSSGWSIAWNRTYVGSGLLEVDSVIQTVDGGFLLGGTTSNSFGEPTRIEVAKVDSLGNLQWNITYDAIGSHYSRWFIQTSDGAFALAGQYEGGFWLAKIRHGSGTHTWNQTYSGAELSWPDGTNSKLLMAAMLLAGQTNSNHGQPYGRLIQQATWRFWLLKTDSLGNEQWNKTLGDGVVNSIIQTNDGGYALGRFHQ